MPKPCFKKLNEQVIVLVGATSGIGLTAARKAARTGARLVLAAHNEQVLQQGADEEREAIAASTIFCSAVSIMMFSNVVVDTEARFLIFRADGYDADGVALSTTLPIALPASTQAWAWRRLAALIPSKKHCAVVRRCMPSTSSATRFRM